MFGQQAATAPNTMNAQQATAIGQTGQTGTQPSLFSGFGQQTQQQTQPTQSLFGNLGQTQQQQQQQPVNQGGGAPSLFGSSTTQPSSTGGTTAFGGGAWNSGNPLLPKSAFGSGSTTIGQAQTGTGLGISLFGQQQPPPQQQQQSTGFGSFLAPTQNQTQQAYGVCFLVFLSSDKGYVYQAPH